MTITNRHKLLVIIAALLLLVSIANAATPVAHFIMTGSQDTYGVDTNPTGDPIGGGDGYSDIITSGDCTATTAGNLVTCLASAAPGDIVYIAGTTSINLTGVSYITVPAGVTLASNRGYGNSSGARLYRTDNSDAWGTIRVGGTGVRITGLRIEGNQPLYNHDYDSTIGVRSGIQSTNKNLLEVDNNEIYYWGYAAISLDNTGAVTYTANIHHNYIHHIGDSGYGYGTMVAYGQATIEGNLYDYTRHAVIGEGCSGETFEWKYNIHGTHSLNPTVDLHQETAGVCGNWTAGGVSGSTYKIHHNTVSMSTSYFFNTYGTPAIYAYLYNNRVLTDFLTLNGTTRLFGKNNYINGIFTQTGGFDTL